MKDYTSPLLEDECKRTHERMVSEIVKALAQYAWSDAEKADMLSEAARLHDIGKNFVPDKILQKSSQLSKREFELVKKHTEKGFQYLIGQIKILMHAAIIALQHHEREDGNGYAGVTNIHETAKLVAVADVFDALISARSYKEGWPPEKVIEFMKEGRGSQFTALYVDVLLLALDDILDLYGARNERRYS